MHYVGYEKLKAEDKEQKASISCIFSSSVDVSSLLPLQTPYVLSAGSQQQIVVANLTGGLTYEFKVSV